MTESDADLEAEIDRVSCDRCGDDASSRGRLPHGEGCSYRFCSECWNRLHQWVQQGRKANDLE